MNIKRIKKEAQHEVNLWNEKYSEGQRVSLMKDDGEIIITKTRSSAWVMGCSAVALFEGIRGSYLLSRATIIARAE